MRGTATEYLAGIDVSAREQRVHRGAGSAFADKIKVLTTEGEVTGDHLFVGRGGRNARRTPRVSANAAGCERFLNRDVPATDSIGTIPAKLPNAT